MVPRLAFRLDPSRQIRSFLFCQLESFWGLSLGEAPDVPKGDPHGMKLGTFVGTLRLPKLELWKTGLDKMLELFFFEVLPPFQRPSKIISGILPPFIFWVFFRSKAPCHKVFLCFSRAGVEEKNIGEKRGWVPQVLLSSFSRLDESEWDAGQTEKAKVKPQVQWFSVPFSKPFFLGTRFLDPYS